MISSCRLKGGLNVLPAFLLVLMALPVACKGREQGPVAAADKPANGSPPPHAALGTSRPVIIVLGTSLTAGLGVDPEQAYPALLQRKIDSVGLDFRVVNAGVSGETSAGSRRQAEWLLQRQPVAMLIIETGANDGLRGLDPDSMRANIQAIVDRARAARPVPKLLLIGMEAPPNLGTAYTRRFRDVYRQLATANDIPLVPFLLEGVAGVDSLNQADGIHPTPSGQRRIVETVWTVLRPVLESAAE